MGKRTRDTEAANAQSVSQSETPFGVPQQIDPSLALLFASSSGPVRPPSIARYDKISSSRKQAVAADDISNPSNDEDEEDQIQPEEEDELSSVDGDIEDELEQEGPSSLVEVDSNKARKRKREKFDDDIEGKYMQKLAREEEKEEEERQAERLLKKENLRGKENESMPAEEVNLEEDDEASVEDDDEDVAQSISAPLDLPLHESLAPDKNTVELEKASRTVFLANVSTAVITDKKSKKVLLEHMASFFDSIPPAAEGKPSHRVESIRFRSTAYAGTALPKKASFATKNLMSATTKSTNAYVVYSTAFAAREAAKNLNATMVLNRHLRVDSVAHPAKTDHRRCVFVGNLGFVDDESLVDQGGENERKRSKIPSDIEEGLWRQFSKAGNVESVRVIRDEKTRVGKGFAYVQFQDPNAVEAALLFHEKKYPPMLPRVLRVTRAKAMNKTALASQHAARPAKDSRTSNPNRQAIYKPKIPSAEQSLQGRASKLLGRAGAAMLRKREGSGKGDGNRKPVEGVLKTPESIVFEGFRASSNSGKPKDLKFGGGGKGSKKRKGKPIGRSAARGAEWKKKGGKKSA